MLQQIVCIQMAYQHLTAGVLWESGTRYAHADMHKQIPAHKCWLITGNPGKKLISGNFLDDPQQCSSDLDLIRDQPVQLLQSIQMCSQTEPLILHRKGSFFSSSSFTSPPTSLSQTE